MTGDLFAEEPLPIQPAPGASRLVGPYARQVVSGPNIQFGKLKFWFALCGAGDNQHRRYELAFDTFDGRATARLRGVGGSLTGFRKHALPADLSRFPSIAYPRFSGDRLADAMISMLAGEDVADATVVRVFRTLPER